MFRAGAFSLLLRAVTLASKFLLILFMARYLSPEDVGVFGLVSAIIGLAIYFLGMDFYAYSTREILGCTQSQRVCRIRDQLVFHLAGYTIFLPLLLGAFAGNFISWRYLGWFYLVLVFEHLNQEVGRLLVTLSRPAAANLVHFFRGGAWVYLVLGMTLWGEGHLDLRTVWAGWSAGSGAGLLLGIWLLRSLDWSALRGVPVDWAWIRKGLADSSLFLAATVAVKAVEYADRFFLQHYHGEAMVGVYTFYANITNVVQVFVFSGITMVLYPRIVSAWQGGERGEYRRLSSRMLVLNCAGAFGLAAVAALGLFPALTLVGKPIYGHHLEAFWIMLGAVVILIAGWTPHYALYVRHRDRMLLTSALLALVVTIALNALLVPRYGVTGAALSTLGGYATLSVMKTVLVLFREKPKDIESVFNETGL